MKYQTCKEGMRPHPRTGYCDAGINHPVNETVKYQQQELPTVEQMRAISEALKGVSQACDITRAKPEFVEFIRTCSPAAIISTLDRLEAQSEHLTTITAQRNRYWEQVEVLVEALKDVRNSIDGDIDYLDLRHRIDDALAAVAEESKGDSEI